MMLLILLLTLCSAAAASSRPNVLFLVADDMRPELGAYLGPDFPSPVHPPVHSPNLDKLAARSLVLKRAYVQQAVCSPSRTSLLTGRRPDTTHVYDLHSYFRKVGGNFTTLPQYFKQHGYRTIGIGKIFHPGAASGEDDPVSWTEPYYHAPNERHWTGPKASWIPVTKEARRAMPLPDEQNAHRAKEWIQKLAKNPDEPFFLAVGLHKPHLPFVFPEEFLDLYPKESIRVPDNQYAPVDMPEVAWSGYNELRHFHDIAKLNATGAINTTLPPDVVRDLRRAYYAATSYSDHLFGSVMDALDESGLANNTIISFWGDHGWQLGEHGEWCKHTNFELATHAPMMVHVPGRTDGGVRTEALTEFVDLYPTLVEAAGLPPLPLCPEHGAANVTLCREGQSLLPLLDKDAPWKDRVFSQYPRGGGKKPIMGYSMRTDQYHYIEWVGFSGPPEYKARWGEVYALELYDHKDDPEENVNVVNRQRYRDVVVDLHNKLLAGWRAVV